MAAARRKPTRKNDPATTRARVLDAAASLFHKQGYAETSMQDIMRRAGVTSGALHHHYPTKKDLGIAVIRERVAGSVDEAWLDPVRRGRTPAKGVGAATRAIIAGMTEGAIVGCPLNNLSIELAHAEPEFREALQEVFDDWHETLAAELRSSGLGRRGSGASADELATLVIAAYSGAMTMAKTSQTKLPLTSTMKLITRMLEQAALQTPVRPPRADARP